MKIAKNIRIKTKLDDERQKLYLEYEYDKNKYEKNEEDSSINNKEDIVEILEDCKESFNLNLNFYIRKGKTNFEPDYFTPVKKMKILRITSASGAMALNLKDHKEDLEYFCFRFPVENDKEIRTCSIFLQMTAGENYLIGESTELLVSNVLKSGVILSGRATSFIPVNQASLLMNSNITNKLYQYKEELCNGCLKELDPRYALKFCKFPAPEDGELNMKDKRVSDCQTFLQNYTIFRDEFLRVKLDIQDPHILARYSLESLEPFIEFSNMNITKNLKVEEEILADDIFTYANVFSKFDFDGNVTMTLILKFKARDQTIYPQHFEKTINMFYESRSRTLGEPIQFAELAFYLTILLILMLACCGVWICCHKSKKHIYDNLTYDNIKSSFNRLKGGRRGNGNNPAELSSDGKNFSLYYFSQRNECFA